MQPPSFAGVQPGLPQETYQKYRGKWIALSADRTRIVSAAAELDELENQLTKLGEDPEKVIFDRIEDDDTWLGGGELF